MDAGDSRKDEDDVSLLCWGSGEHSQHGHVYADPATRGVDVASHAGRLRLNVGDSRNSSVRTVACGSSHTVVLTVDGEMYSWGHGYSGSCNCEIKKLNAASVSRLVLQSAVAETNGCGRHAVAGLDCGGRQTAVWLENGNVWIIDHKDLHYCQSADNHQAAKTANVKAHCDVASVPPTLSLQPVLLPSKSFVTKVACGDRHTIFLLESGALYASGNNTYGQLGTGDRIEARTPIKLDIEFVHLVACGAHHSMAVTVEGDLLVWGYGKAIGDKAEDIVAPTRKVKHHTNIMAIAAGGAHCLALTENGNVYSWGVGVDGQLGHGPEENFLAIPRKLGDKRLRAQTAAISAGDLFSAAITASGELYMWGKNSHTIDHHQVAAARIYLPIKVDTAGLPVKTVACGTWHAACIVGKPEVPKNDHSSDKMSCWGDGPESANTRIAKDFKGAEDVSENSTLHSAGNTVAHTKKVPEQQRPMSRGIKRRDSIRQHASEIKNHALSNESDSNIWTATIASLDSPAITSTPAIDNANGFTQDAGSRSELGLLGAKQADIEHIRVARTARKTPTSRRVVLDKVSVNVEQSPQQDSVGSQLQSAVDLVTEGQWAARDASAKDFENVREAAADDLRNVDDVTTAATASERMARLHPTAASHGRTDSFHGAPLLAANRRDELTKRTTNGLATHGDLRPLAMAEMQVPAVSPVTGKTADGLSKQSTMRRMSFDLDGRFGGGGGRNSKGAPRHPRDWSSHDDLNQFVGSPLAHNGRAVFGEQRLSVTVGAARLGLRLPAVGERVGNMESDASTTFLDPDGTSADRAKADVTSAGFHVAYSALQQSHGVNRTDGGKTFPTPLENEAMRYPERRKVVNNSSRLLEARRDNAELDGGDAHHTAIEKLATRISSDVINLADRGRRRGVTSGVDKRLSGESQMRTPATVGFIDDRSHNDAQPRHDGLNRQRTVSIPPRDVYNNTLVASRMRHRGSVSQPRATPQLRRSMLSHEPPSDLSKASRPRAAPLCEELLVISVKSASGDSAKDAGATLQPAGGLRYAPAQHS